MGQPSQHHDKSAERQLFASDFDCSCDSLFHVFAAFPRTEIMGIQIPKHYDGMAFWYLKLWDPT